MWLCECPQWTQEYLSLFPNVHNNLAAKSNVEEIINKSNAFPLKFPLEAVRCNSLKSIVNQTILERNINSAYPIIHEISLHLCAKFLLFKKSNGTQIEKNLYGNFNIQDFLQRLITKKAATFIDPAFEFYLSDGTRGSGNWETVGTEQELPPLELKNCLSYDEMKLSALISISSYSYFINNGARQSRGKVEENRNELQFEGIIISIVGPKFTMQNLYDYQDIILSKQVPNRQLSNMFSSFYNEPIITFKEAKTIAKRKSNNKYIKIRSDNLFNNDVYKKRLAISFDTFLLEANHRAKENRTVAYVHLVGIGLGVWCISGHQEKVFVDALAERLQVLGSRINYISDIHLSYFNNTEFCGKVKDGNVFPIPGHSTGITIHISKREPFTKLLDINKLLIVSYAADGNSLPGNEFWKGFLGNSADSATASSSQIAELHNPHINKLICADNLKIVTCDGLLITLPQYITTIKK